MTFNEELKEILGRELKILSSLCELAEEKTNVIVGGDVRKIEEMTLKEESLLNSLANVEVERGKLLDSWGLGEDTPISELLQKMQGEKGDIYAIKDEMTYVIERLLTANKVNQTLINDNLDWIDFNINLFTNATVDPTYSKSSPNVSRGGGSFDRKV